MAKDNRILAAERIKDAIVWLLAPGGYSAADVLLLVPERFDAHTGRKGQKAAGVAVEVSGVDELQVSKDTVYLLLDGLPLHTTFSRPRGVEVESYSGHILSIYEA